MQCSIFFKWIIGRKFRQLKIQIRSMDGETCIESKLLYFRYRIHLEWFSNSQWILTVVIVIHFFCCNITLYHFIYLIFCRLYIKQPPSSTSIADQEEEPDWTEYKIKETNMFTVDKYQQVLLTFQSLFVLLQCFFFLSANDLCCLEHRLDSFQKRKHSLSGTKQLVC